MPTKLMHRLHKLRVAGGGQQLAAVDRHSTQRIDRPGVALQDRELCGWRSVGPYRPEGDMRLIGAKWHQAVHGGGDAED